MLWRGLLESLHVDHKKITEQASGILRDVKVVAVVLYQTAPTRPVGIKGEIQMGAMGRSGVVLALLAIVVGVLWTLLPFAVFGIKALAKSLISEQKRTNELLSQLVTHNKSDSAIEVKRTNWE